MKSVLLFAAALAFTGIGASTSAPKPAKSIKVLLVLGGCCHDYEHQKDVLAKGLAERANVAVTIAYDPDTSTSHKNPVYENSNWAKGFDVVIHDECTSDVKDMDFINNILAPHRAGLPAVFLHCGMHSYRSEGFPQSTPWFDLTGMPSTGHGPQLPIAVTFVDSDNPITKGLSDWSTVNEELYNNSAGKPLDTAHPLARGKQMVKGSDGQEKPVEYVSVWTNTYAGKTRVFATTLGHNTETVADSRYLDLVTRGLLWSVKKLGKDGKPVAGYGPK